MPLDGNCVFSSDDILQLKDLPGSLAVIGAGVIGCEYASIFAALGVRVTMIEKTPRLLPFVDAEIIEALTYHLRERRVTMRLGEEVNHVELVDDGSNRPRVKIGLISGKQIVADKVLRSTGRSGATLRLNLGAAGVTSDGRGRIKVNEVYQSEFPTSTRPATSSDFPASRRPRGSKAVSPRVTHSGRKPDMRPNCSRTASIPFPKSRSSGKTRKS